MFESILVLNGPNLNLLGKRQSDIYGSEDLASIINKMSLEAKKVNIKFDHFTSNHEGELIDAIHKARDNHDFIILNAGALTHTSIALRDAMLAAEIPFIEVHISNIYKREIFRQHSYLSDIALGVVTGLGFYSYMSALHYAIDYIKNKLK